MKLYKKIDNNGISHIMPYNKIIIIKDDMQIFNPTEEMLFEDGWVEYVLLESHISDEEVLAMEKEHLINDVLYYDSSDEVNIFYVNNTPIWLDKATRAGLMLRFQAEKALGKNETSLWYGDNEFKMSLDNAVMMLYMIEVYASACYDNTQRHIHNINLITSLDDVKKYNYKLGYPEKHRF